MEHTKWDVATATICGIIGGMIKFYERLISISYLEALAKAGFTALVCGFLGVAGKHVFTQFMKYIKSKRKSK
ncbi:MAG: hypothetical protein ACT4OJ_06245 [Bacteroidota bacterium]